MILFGRDSFSPYTELRYLIISTVFKEQGLKITSNVKFIGYVNDEELVALYKYASCFVYPSIYEGFGIPALEAFSLGKDVIVSDIPVMHEIFENEANYINPNQYDFDFNNIIHSDKKEKILEKFSWENSAKMLLNLLNNINKK